MELKINWPDGATHFCQAFGRYETRAYKKDGEVWHRWTGFDWHELKFPPVVSVLRQLIKRPSGVNEGGERFPPIELPLVGADVEFYCATDDSPRWHRFEVLYSGEAGLVCRFASDQRELHYSMSELKGVELRAYRTPEQIAAETYAAAVHQLMHDAGILGSAFEHDPEAMAWAQSAINQGWIKPC